MDTPDFEHGRVYFKQFGAERVNGDAEILYNFDTRCHNPFSHAEAF